MYVRPGVQGTSQPGSIQGNQTDDNTYNVINEDDVYDPSGHYYSDIKDQDAGVRTTQILGNDNQNDNTYNEINDDDVYDPSGHYYSEIKDEDIENRGRSVLKSRRRRRFHGIEEVHIDGAPGQASLNDNSDDTDDDPLDPYMYVGQDSESENSADGESLASYVRQTSQEHYEDNEDGSLTFCSVASEVGLPMTNEVGANALLYKIGTRAAIASVNCRLRRFSLTKSADQTTYGMTDFAETSNHAYISTSGTSGDVVSENIEGSVREHSENIFVTVEEDSVEAESNVDE
ncbi:Hypp4277 [Branchiostoma lanceolatum]|uniref:Hypp4277 protein n=1 Tax=Branchiostoma lanceolatum TaxID=7740 RepID=A0A8K0F0E9_BRALA|nr:Hypp4277 [Branchiostoma lanceolatum]